MRKLSDYSGEFLHDLKLNDFSPAALVKLLTLYSKLFIALDGFWYLTIKERQGNKEALAYDIQVWESLCKYEMARIKRQLKIKGNGIIPLMKAMQLLPWFQIMKRRIEIKDASNALLMVTYCPTLDALETEGKGREDEICNLVEPRILKAYASFFNPDIKVKCLKSPPRKNKDDICCQWQFRLVSKSNQAKLPPRNSSGNK